MKTSSIKQNAVLNIIYTLSNLLFPLITFPYVSRVLGVDYMGKVNFFTSLSTYAIMVASMGISTYGIRAVAQKRDDKKQLSKLVWELFFMNLVATIVVVAILMGGSPVIGRFRTDFALLVANCVLILSAPFGMNWLFSGLEQYAYITKRSILFKVISLALIFLLVHGEGDYVRYAWILVFSSAGSYVYNFIYARRFLLYERVKLEFKEHVKPMLLLFASIFAINVYTQLDTVMLGFLSGDREVGLYTVAVYAKTALLALINAISAVLLPRFSYYYSANKTEEWKRVLSKSTTVIMMIALPMVLFFMIEAKNTILILGGADYLDAVLCMQLIMPILLISGFSNITGNQILIPQGKDSCFMKAVITGAVVDLVLNLLLMPKFGCVGAAVATLLAELTQMSIQFSYARKTLKGNLNLKSLLCVLLSTGISCGVLVFVNQWLGLPALVNMIIGLLIFGLIYAGCLWGLREQEFHGLLGSAFGFCKKLLKR